MGDSQETNVSEDIPDEDVLKVLLATDIHLGYKEQDAIRGDDSFNTFEEILKKAVEYQVDMILLGGDLFHDSKPSPMCYHRCITLLKRYCLGDKPVAIEFLSDQSLNFPYLKNPIVNYEDPNLNVSIPCFSIHGNHDDPTGASQLSAMDILADTGLVNYFGKWTDLSQVELYPLLMKKGQTKLAIYGLSHIKDERLSRLFKDNKVTLLRPEDSGDWFHLMALHQNRAQNRGSKNYIPYTVLPEFLNLVLWGHEHDCRIEPESQDNGPYITQPGSSVATSLAMGESLTKHVGLLIIHKVHFKLHKIKLKTVRPFIFKEIVMKRPDSVEERLVEYAKEQVAVVINSMIAEAKSQMSPESPKLPLIRLIVNFTDESLMSNAIRFGQQFSDKVANPQEMLVFKVRRPLAGRRARTGTANDDDIEELEGEQIAERVEQLVHTYFDAKKTSLQVLSMKGLSEAVSRFIDRSDTDAIPDIYKYQYEKTLNRLMEVEGDISLERLDELLDQYKNEREITTEAELEEYNRMFNDENRRQKTSVSNTIDDDSDVEIMGMTTQTTSASTKPTRGRGSRGSRKPRGRAK